MGWVGRILIWIVGLAALVGLAVFLFFKVRALWAEWSAIGHYRLRELAALTRTRAIEEWQDFDRRREWASIGRLSDEAFQVMVKRLRDSAARENGLADILLKEALRRGTDKSDFLLQRAKARRTTASEQIKEAKRLEALRAEIKASGSGGGSQGDPGDDGKREPPKRPRNQREQVLGLIEKLGSGTDVLAQAALDAFNQLGAAVLWENLVPDDLPKLVKARLVKILRQMSRTNNLGEARNARAQAEYILKAHNLSWDHLRDGLDRKAA